MKIGFLGFDFAPGKVKYQDPRLAELEKKLSPKKTHPFFVEFISNSFESADIIACLKEKILDVFIPDIEKLERYSQTAKDEIEKQLFLRVLASLEKEVPLCDLELSEKEISILCNLNLLTFKPTVIEKENPRDVSQFLRRCFDKAGVIFFYTTAKSELKSWPIKKDTPIIEAAAKIHSDLARGFIKADVINFDDFATMYNIQEAKSKGKVKLVDRGYIIADGDIVEIKFNI